MRNTNAVPEAGPAQAVGPIGRFFTNQTFHYETFLEWLEGRELPGVAPFPRLMQINEFELQWANTHRRKEESVGPESLP